MIDIKRMMAIIITLVVMLSLSGCDLINKNAAEDIEGLLAPIEGDQKVDENQPIKEGEPVNEDEPIKEDEPETEDEPGNGTIEDSSDSTTPSDNEPDKEIVLNHEEELVVSFYDLIGPVTYNYLEGQVIVIDNPDSYYALINKKNELPSDYVPRDLVIPDIRFSFDGEPDKKFLREIAAIHIAQLFDDAELEGLYLFGVSGYRSYKTQKTIFDNKVAQRGEEEANKTSARPGQSEHQSGLTMDVSCSSVGYGLETTFGDTPEGLWLADHAHEYGFTIRYLKDKVDITGYSYEPWHIRYIGIELATYLYENHMTLDEFYEWYEPMINGLEFE